MISIPRFTSMSLLVACLLVAFSTAPVVTNAQSASDSPNPQASVCTGSKSLCDFFTAYLVAFNTRNLSAFSAAFSNDVSFYFDKPISLERRDTHESVLAVFRPGFAAVNGSGVLPPPLVPEHLRIQESGDFAVLSFDARDGPGTMRRTIVTRRQGGVWRVIHIHASSGIR